MQNHFSIFKFKDFFVAKSCGYRFVALDLAGFRSGSLNEGIIEVVNVG